MEFKLSLPSCKYTKMRGMGRTMVMVKWLVKGLSEQIIH